MTEFGQLNSDGSYEKIATVSQEDIRRCTFAIINPFHYRKDGSCRCNELEDRGIMVREWGYTWDQFKDIPLLPVEMPADDSGYSRSDPKHPSFHSSYSDLWDSREGK